MIGINNYYPINVLTHSGVVELNYIVPGDYVYEYKTGNLLKVIDVTKPKKFIIHEVLYNDGRISYIGEDDYIFTGENIEYMQNVNKYTKFSEIKQTPIDFHKMDYNRLEPDPYIAAIFLIYGDLHDKYINLPYDFININKIQFNNYSIEYNNDDVSINKVYFKYSGDSKNRKITWDRFFNSINVLDMYENIRFPIIPSIYSRSSIKNRIKFIRGLFDFGYSSRMFKDSDIGIVHNDINKLKAVQELLWSIGILSKISHDNYISKRFNFKYKLVILGIDNGYPGLFYDIDKIVYLLDNNRSITYDRKFKLEINEIDYKHFHGIDYATGYMSNLILEKPQALYLDNKYLPRVSV